MNSTADQNYWTAAAQSFKWQVKTREVPISDREVTEIPLGFQPFGISARDDTVLIADYFAPAVCMNRVTVDGSVLKFEVTWVHGAMNGITRCRGGFPDISYPSGANRCVTAFFAPDGKSVCIGRLGRVFFLLSPQDNAQWKIAAKVSLPECPDYPFVHSATLEGGSLSTVESNAGMDLWRIASYCWEGENDWSSHPPKLRVGAVDGISRFRYGLAFLKGEEVLVASSHSVRGNSATPSGIYMGEELIVPGIVGSGICLLPNGAALVAQYGQEEEGAHKGNPGKLLYVPQAFLAGV